MLQRIRAAFAERSVLEVDTPALSAAAVSDPHIESIAASLRLDSRREYYLHTSPEYCMKRLLCDGYPDIYQVCKVFRDGEAGRNHQPEFTMLEWYRLGYNLDEIVCDALEIIGIALERSSVGAVRLSYRDAFTSHANFDPFAASVDEIRDRVGADESLTESVGDDRDAWLDIALDRLVVPLFTQDVFTVLFHYPVSQAALARACSSDAAVADRFEVFLGAKELANGYVELTEPDEQQRRFSADQGVRDVSGNPVRPLDNDFLAAIDSGLPPCAGVAVGLDRLLMIASGLDDIRTVQTFAFREP